MEICPIGKFQSVSNRIADMKLRLETSRLASSRSGGKGIAGIEVLAFGTGIRRLD